MKATGIVRELDFLGRIVLPVQIRKKLEIEIQDPLEIYVGDDFIMLKKYFPQCVLCGESDNILTFQAKNICKKCKDEIK